MALYTVKKKTDKSSDDEKVLYYAVPSSSSLKDIHELAEEISQDCSLTPGDVLSAVSALSVCLERHVLNGNSVKLPGIGVFSLAVSSPGFDTPEECTPSKVVAKRICFKADKKLRNKLPCVKFKKKE